MPASVASLPIPPFGLSPGHHSTISRSADRRPRGCGGKLVAAGRAGNPAVWEEAAGLPGEIMTEVGAIVATKRADEVPAAFTEFTQRPLPEGLLRTELLAGPDGEWKVHSLWPDQAALDASGRRTTGRARPVPAARRGTGPADLPPAGASHLAALTCCLAGYRNAARSGGYLYRPMVCLSAASRYRHWPGPGRGWGRAAAGPG